MTEPTKLRILYIAYPMLAVTRESCGGAEQMLWTLEREMARRGHQTTVAACDGSHVAGRLFATGMPPCDADSFQQRNGEHISRILRMLQHAQSSAAPFDVVHDHSGGFWPFAEAVQAPVLATLHLPRGFYPAAVFGGVSPNVCFNCVSKSQQSTFDGLARMSGVVRNGICLESFPALSSQRSSYLLWMGRICEEKGTHVAIEVARRTGRKLVLAGGVYPFSYHQEYFDRRIRPHLDDNRVRHVGVPSFAEKLDYLAHARALLLPSLADETSSVVAMEAMACGTPVIAFRRGAIPEVVRQGVTGFLVDSPEEMARAVEQTGEIDPLACRAHVEANFSARRMAEEYERLYGRVIAQHEQLAISI